MSGKLGTSKSRSGVIGTSQDTAKAWVNFNGTGTAAIRDDYNVSTIDDLGTGNYRINFSVTWANANYVNAVGGLSDSSDGNVRWLSQTTSQTILKWYNLGSPLDMSNCTVIFFGD